MITAERKAELQALGYYVEDMGKEHGTEWEGQFRFMNSKSDDFQDWDTSESEDLAWKVCARHVFNLECQTLDPYEHDEIERLTKMGELGEERFQQLMRTAKQRFAAKHEAEFA